jgi:hypothetical protein
LIVTQPSEPVPGKLNHYSRECMVCAVPQAVFARIAGSAEPGRCLGCGSPEGAMAPASGERPKLGASNGHALDGNGGAKEALDALEPERAAAEHVAVGLQRDLAVATAECARLRGELETLKQSHEVQHAFWLKTTGEVQSKRSELMELRDSLQQQLDAAQKQAAWALQEQAKAVAALESERVKRWHATFNAALSTTSTADDQIGRAVKLATKMHGALVPGGESGA